MIISANSLLRHHPEDFPICTGFFNPGRFPSFSFFAHRVGLSQWRVKSVRGSMLPLRKPLKTALIFPQRPLGWALPFTG